MDKSTRVKFTGIMPALLTPLMGDGSINEAAARGHIAALAQTGITGLYVLGSTGEGISLDADTRIQFAELVRDAAPKSLKLINHIGAADLATVKRLARHARASGYDGISSVPPFFFNYDERGIIDYYRAMSDASEGLPLLIYASPLSGPMLPVSTVEKMLDIPGFCGMKFTNPNYYLLSRYKNIAGGDINIINGPDETCLLGLMMGADGAIGSTYNVMPRLFVRLYELFRAGEIASALQLQLKADRLIELLIKYNVVHGCKLILSQRGFEMGDTSAPLPRLDAEQAKAFLREYEALGGDAEFN